MKCNIDKLNEILLPIGFECHSFEWGGKFDHYFELPNTPKQEYFFTYSEERNWLCVYPTYGNVDDFVENNEGNITFNLKKYAEQYIKTYKNFIQNEKLERIKEDFE